ncbi:MAG: Zn-dependent hydrolase, partial [Gammaproteobacteria bacterium]|nr:Zn-dependent hydrolase [Gammaproteobacteria bacterium]
MAASALLPRTIAARGGAAPLHIDLGRLQRTLEELSTFGRPQPGTFADGVSRVAYSDADIAGRAYVMGIMRDAALAPRIDTAGNLIGRRAGRAASLPPILMGSHIDSVRSGGNFDGDLGSLAAIEVVRTLNDAHLVTRHPLEVRIWSNEEGGTVGSSAAAGLLPAESLTLSFYGTTLRDGLRRIGGDPERLEQARIAPGSFRCYLELHIEQGGNLDRAGIPIGVVDGIVSIDRYEVEVRGFANHAGTTPMPERQDALLAAARLIDAVHEVVTRTPGRQVGTVGQLEVLPNAPNVIPGLVRHSLEFRDLSA